MATRKYVNSANPATTLASGYTSGGVTMTVNSAANLPSSGDFIILVGSEFIKVTGVSGTTLTVVGAQESSSASNHSSGDSVYHIVSAGTLDGIRADICQTGTDAAKPSAEKAGILYLPSDGVQVYRDTGAALNPWGPMFRFTDPTLQSWAWINQGSATVDSTNGAIYLFNPAGAAYSPVIRKKAAPATPYTITAAFLPAIFTANFNTVFLCFRNSSSSKAHSFGQHYENGTTLDSNTFTSPSTFNAHYGGFPTSIMWGPLPVLWLKIQDDGTNRICSMSHDGQHWVVIHTVVRTDFFTADEVGFGVTTQNATFGAGATLLSWKES